jgi:hypothetical protein
MDGGSTADCHPSFVDFPELRIVGGVEGDSLSIGVR